MPTTSDQLPSARVSSHGVSPVPSHNMSRPRSASLSVPSTPSAVGDAPLPPFPEPASMAVGRGYSFPVPLSRRLSEVSSRSSTSGSGALRPRSASESAPALHTKSSSALMGCPVSPRSSGSTTDSFQPPIGSRSSAAPGLVDMRPVPRGRFAFAQQPLRGQGARLAAPHSGVRYTFLSTPSSCEDMPSMPSVQKDHALGPESAPFVVPQVSVSGSRERRRRWVKPRAPRMTGTGGGYGYISGSAESSLVLPSSQSSQSEAEVRSSAPPVGMPQDTCPSYSSADEEDPLLALQRLTIDLYHQKHSVPTALNSGGMSSSPEGSSSHLIPSSSTSDDGLSEVSRPPSPNPHPTRTSADTSTPTSMAPASGIEGLPHAPASDGSTSCRTASPAKIATPHPRPSLRPSYQTRKRAARRSATPRRACRPLGLDGEEYEQASRAGTKRGRQPAAPVSGGARPHLAPTGAHVTESGTSVCDYTSPVTGVYCGTRFHRTYDLVRHRETVHGRDEALEIRRGNLSPAQAVVWGKEVDAAASGADREWLCAACGSSFSRKDALTRHRRVRAH